MSGFSFDGRQRNLSPDSLRIAVLAGGDSAEREVSLQSGAAVSRALAELGCRVDDVDPVQTDLQAVAWDDFDAAFLALHGTFGEDGQVQALLDDAGVPYTGSDAATSRLAFSKSASKERFRQCGLPTPDAVVVNAYDDRRRIRQLAERLGYPLVVKPDAQGSSLGVTPVSGPDQLPLALESCFKFGPFGLLETAIIGTEWTVGLIDDEILPVIEITSARTFYDYYAKYQDDLTGYRFEFDLPAEVVREIAETGRRAAQAIGTRGVARVDLRMDEALHPWILEVNTIPGMTDHSLVPKAAQVAGISFPQLCWRSIESCLKRAVTLRTTGSDRPARRRAG